MKKENETEIDSSQDLPPVNNPESTIETSIDARPSDTHPIAHESAIIPSTEIPPMPPESQRDSSEIPQEPPTHLKPKDEQIMDVTNPVAPPSSDEVTSRNSALSADLAASHLNQQDSTLQIPEALQQTSESLPENRDVHMQDYVPATTKAARGRDDDDDDINAPAAKRAKTEEADPQPPSSLPAASDPIATDSAATDQASLLPDQTSLNAVAGVNGSATPTQSVAQPVEDFGPLTDFQSRRLVDGLRNLKKNKSAAAFLKPVDWQTMKLLTYPDIVKHPMDLSTMETKLKNGNYTSVNEYVLDFEQMVQNTLLFNGPAHLVTVAGNNLRSQLSAQLRKLPKKGEVAQAPPPKQERISPVRKAPDTKRRTSKPVDNTATSTFPVTDGVPQIRRASTLGDMGRPKREIKKPAPHEVSYEQPRQKKFQPELAFCDHIMEELKKAKYHAITFPFMEPVDAVALGIPHYPQVIKHPTDIRTITEKLHNNGYRTANEFKKDMDLIQSNALKFNGVDHPITNMANQVKARVDELWRNKQSWINDHTASAAQSSDESDEEMDDDDGADDNEAKIKAITEQIALLQEQTLGLLQTSVNSKIAKNKSKKSNKNSKPSAVKKSRKSGSFGGASTMPIKQEKKMAKPKSKLRPVSNTEKHEISERIGELPAEMVGNATNIIHNAFRRENRHDLIKALDEDGELEIDQIPDDALRELLKLVRDYAPPVARADDDAYESPPPHEKGSKSKKNKPMSKVEQEATIESLKGQLQVFQDPNAHMGESQLILFLFRNVRESLLTLCFSQRRGWR